MSWDSIYQSIASGYDFKPDVIICSQNMFLSLLKPNKYINIQTNKRILISMYAQVIKFGNTELPKKC